jgi:hypothetical protein
LREHVARVTRCIAARLCLRGALRRYKRELGVQAMEVHRTHNGDLKGDFFDVKRNLVSSFGGKEPRTV